ncbi:hypothetical protein C4577_05200 [Candidatus Parcubacteria bacterium]|nr:MAG: hypothetical protein C4577_05200 [Candidatus Parcubacteria bacterium]
MPVKNLDGVFGKTEIESAAERIIFLCELYGTWSTMICYENMQTGSEQYGFLHLLHNQYMIYMPERGFYPNKDFINVINKARPGEVSLPGDGTFECLASTIYGSMSIK